MAIALLFIFLMMGSTIAYSFLQSFKPPEEETVELPTSRIVESELSVEQESLLIKQDQTVIKFYYSLACDSCLNLKNLLESLTTAEGFSKQVYIEEIKSSGNVPKIVFISKNGQQELKQNTDNDIVDALCEMMVNPPIRCATRNVQ
jgi:hypothetical protein